MPVDSQSNTSAWLPLWFDRSLAFPSTIACAYDEVNGVKSQPQPRRAESFSPISRSNLSLCLVVNCHLSPVVELNLRYRCFTTRLQLFPSSPSISWIDIYCRFLGFARWISPIRMGDSYAHMRESTESISDVRDSDSSLSLLRQLRHQPLLLLCCHNTFYYLND